MADAEKAGLPGAPPAPEDIASYLHTGGTTGTPKLAARTHANEVPNAWMTRASNLLDESSVIFAALRLFHTNALVVTVLAPLLKGQHVVWGGPLGYRDVPPFENFWKIVERYRIAAMSEHIDKIRKDAGERKVEHDVKRAEHHAEHREDDAEAAVAFAYAAFEEAEYAVLDAILARQEADELVAAR